MENRENKNKEDQHINNCWEYFEHSNVTNDGHAHATCKFYGETWYREEKALIEGYLANYCKEASGIIIREYLKKFHESETSFSNSNSKKQKTAKNSQTFLEQSFHQIEKLTSGCIDRINWVLIKAFICCGISF